MILLLGWAALALILWALAQPSPPAAWIDDPDDDDLELPMGN